VAQRSDYAAEIDKEPEYLAWKSLNNIICHQTNIQTVHYVNTIPLVDLSKWQLRLYSTDVNNIIIIDSSPSVAATAQLTDQPKNPKQRKDPESHTSPKVLTYIPIITSSSSIDAKVTTTTAVTSCSGMKGIPVNYFNMQS
jgi:hypothetical protein